MQIENDREFRTGSNGALLQKNTYKLYYSSLVSFETNPFWSRRYSSDFLSRLSPECLLNSAVIDATNSSYYSIEDTVCTTLHDINGNETECCFDQPLMWKAFILPRLLCALGKIYHMSHINLLTVV